MPISRILISRSSEGTTVIDIPPEHLEEFKEMVRRATNCWPDASPELKKFADRLLHGALLQDYDSQTGRQRPE